MTGRTRWAEARLDFRCTKAELAAWKKAAKRYGYRVFSDWVRQSLNIAATPGPSPRDEAGKARRRAPLAPKA